MPIYLVIHLHLFVFSKTPLTFLMNMTLQGIFEFRNRSIRVSHPEKINFWSYPLTSGSRAKMMSENGFSFIDTKYYDVIFP